MAGKAITSLTGMGGWTGSNEQEVSVFFKKWLKRDQRQKKLKFSPQSSESGSSAREGEEGRHSFYTLHNVRKIDNYSRRIFPTLYVLFVLYFFIRLYH